MYKTTPNIFLYNQVFRIRPVHEYKGHLDIYTGCPKLFRSFFVFIKQFTLDVRIFSLHFLFKWEWRYSFRARFIVTSPTPIILAKAQGFPILILHHLDQLSWDEFWHANTVRMPAASLSVFYGFIVSIEAVNISSYSLFPEHWVAVMMSAFWHLGQNFMIQVTLFQYSNGFQFSCCIVVMNEWRVKES